MQKHSEKLRRDKIGDQSLLHCLDLLCDSIAGKDEDILTDDIKLKLMSSLSCLPSGRREIINLIERNLCTSNLKDKNHAKLITPRNHQDKINILLEGLLILIQEKRNTSDCTVKISLYKMGLEALTRITNLIMLNRPAISLQKRSSFSLKLGSLVESGTICSWVSENLLSAALIVLLRHFHSTSLFRLDFTPHYKDQSFDAIRENIALPMKFAILLKHNQTKNQSDIIPRSKFSTEEIGILLDSISTMKQIVQQPPFDKDLTLEK
jgi:hypothetical protein